MSSPLLDLCEAPAPEGDDFVARIARHFLARPGQWVDATELERVGGRQAWRTRCSECRRRYAMRIDNRVYTAHASDGRKFRISEYRYVPEGY